MAQPPLHSQPQGLCTCLCPPFQAVSSKLRQHPHFQTPKPGRAPVTPLAPQTDSWCGLWARRDHTGQKPYSARLPVSGSCMPPSGWGWAGAPGSELFTSARTTLPLLPGHLLLDRAVGLQFTVSILFREARGLQECPQQLGDRDS